MNPYPQDRSILILDNCAIHKSELLREVVEAQSKFLVLRLSLELLSDCLTDSVLLFLPPYSPDLNPIEESFSAGNILSL